MVSLAGLEYRTVREISGPLIFVESVRGVGYGELARIRTPSGEERRGQVLEVGGGVAVVRYSKERPDSTFPPQLSVSPEKQSSSLSHRTCSDESSTAAADLLTVARESSLTTTSM